MPLILFFLKLIIFNPINIFRYQGKVVVINLDFWGFINKPISTLKFFLVFVFVPQGHLFHGAYFCVYFLIYLVCILIFLIKVAYNGKLRKIKFKLMRDIKKD